MRAQFAAAPAADADLRLAAAENLLTGRPAFTTSFGAPTTLEEDLLNVLAAIYACDLGFKRSPRERFLRRIELSIAVTNRQAFQAIQADLEYALYLLSQDAWSLDFPGKPGQLEAVREWAQRPGITLLFSGGVDSFCAAADFLEQGQPLYLVSHITHNQVVAHSQNTLHAALEALYGRPVPRFAARVSARSRSQFPFPRDAEREDTQRTRSLLFLGLACLAARRTGFANVVTIAENGQMALHLPLTAARAGAFSTHTAHPEFVDLAQAFFSRVLSYDFRFSNPYLYLTKAEVVRRLPAALYPQLTEAVSCWRGSRLRGSTHCGECVPCLVRRFALEACGIVVPEYQRDLFAEDIGALPPEDRGKANIVDLLELVRHFSTPSHADQPRIIEQFPDLINPSINLADAIALYVRFAQEARGVIANYPSLRALLP